ncbi:outer membrane beta-barrel protein [Duganella sp. FT135W]|uniref:Outer membrane beta-barrel protein n=1 Tax=Duganella flavida TaxID=2692175 RepID=A0A6L8K2A8_9BURK|nr:outer membrane beta-barrel protein [Duganella flavida]MYM21055.1 outer membrane beta-barrel protein [Duganella flavida]
MKKIAFAVAALLATVGAAQAQTQSPVRFLAGLGISGGGDNLATAKYTNGSSQKIKAGGGVYFTTGADYRLSEEFSVQGTVNFHVDDTNANNGSIKFQRFPVELLGYYHVDNNWRVGAGVRYTASPKLTSSGAASGLDVKFDNAVSGVLEAEYFWTPKFGMKMRYVNETFKKSGYPDVKANHVGISANYYF